MTQTLAELVSTPFEQLNLDVKCLLGYALSSQHTFWRVAFALDDCLPGNLPLEVRAYQHTAALKDYVTQVRHETNRRLAMQGQRLRLSTVQHDCGVYQFNAMINDTSCNDNLRRSWIAHALSVMREVSRAYVETHRGAYTSSNLRDTQPIGKP